MQVKATAKYLKISPKKARPMADALRGMRTNEALASLSVHTTKAGRLFHKLIHSAVSNAINNYNLKENNLRIATVTVDGGPTYKRSWYRSHGSADRLLKRTSHFHIVIDEISPSLVKQPVAKSAVVAKNPIKSAKPKTASETSSDAAPAKAAVKDASTPKRTSTNKATNK